MSIPNLHRKVLRKTAQSAQVGITIRAEACLQPSLSLPKEEGGISAALKKLPRGGGGGGW